MSTKPNTPREHGPAGNSKIEHIPTGRRFSSNSELLRIEKELIAEGIELPNRAIPAEYHAEIRSYEPGEITELIEQETNKDHPNRQLIGYLNEVRK
jgi:hypothetical protein